MRKREDIDAYRRDVRDERQFSRDIREGHRIERIIVERFAEIVERNTGFKPTVKDNGCDNTGRWMPASKISTSADFTFNGHPLEVKFCNPWSPVFHFKVKQIASYVRQNAYLLYVHGYDTADPKYLIFTPYGLREIFNKRQTVVYWEKECYQFEVSEFSWLDFKLS